VGIPDESSASEKYNGSGRHAEMFCKSKEYTSFFRVIKRMEHESMFTYIADTPGNCAFFTSS
jgi:hypothetical protein